MLTILQLKGLSILLKRLMVCNKQKCEEVQAMQASGHRVLVSANNASEVEALSKVLGTIGVTASNWRDKLKPAFLAMLQVAKHDSGVPLAKVIQGPQVWDADADHLPALMDLANLPEWQAGATYLLNSAMVTKTAKKPKPKNDPAMPAYEAMHDTLVQGFDLYRLGDIAKGKFPMSANTPKLELGGDGDLVLVQSAANDIHAEQSLLLALVNHLSLGGQSANVNIAGGKLPCDKCVKMLNALDAAFFASFLQHISFDTNTTQSNKHNSPTNYITMPNNSGTHATYTTFLSHYTAPT